MKYIVLIVAITSMTSCSNNEEETIEYRTRYFDFNNHYWVNLHHFLYQKADSSQLRKLQEDGLSFLEIGDSNAQARLSGDEKEVLGKAIGYYKDSLTIKSLRRDLASLKVWLQEKEEFKTITDTSFGIKFIEILNDVSPVYKEHFWDLHKSHNLSILTRHIETISKIEDEVINKMEALSLNPWPDSAMVRVDMTAYANWAGAYTSSKPKMNIVISSTDPSQTTSSFVETILHEGSHLLYLFGESPIRDKFYYKSEELGMKFPRNLWHASMFYLCGRATQDALSELGISHEMVMDKSNIFTNYNTPGFRRINEEYYNGKIGPDSMVIRLLTGIKKKSH